jgi:hypothetical protein
LFRDLSQRRFEHLHPYVGVVQHLHQLSLLVEPRPAYLGHPLPPIQSQSSLLIGCPERSSGQTPSPLDQERALHVAGRRHRFGPSRVKQLSALLDLA